MSDFRPDFTADANEESSAVTTRLATFARDARGEVVPPKYDDLAAAWRRRRRGAAILSGAATVVVLGLVWVGAQGLSNHSATPTPPANTGQPTPAPTPNNEPGETPTEQLTAEQIVEAKDSYLVALSTSADNPDAKVSVWRCREQPRCPGWRGAIVVTDDNFASRTVLDLPRFSNLVATDVGDGMFLVGDARHAVLVASDGTVVPTDLDDTTGPLAHDETLVSSGTSGGGWAGLDARSGTWHPLSLPPGNGAIIKQTPDGMLWGLTYRTGFPGVAVWSTDGGATWQEHPLPAEFSQMAIQPAEVAGPNTMAFVIGGDGATLFPFDKIYRTLDGGQTWETVEESPGAMAYVSWSLVRPDGTLLALLDAWSDDRNGHPGSHPHGLYESNGSDWSDLHYVPFLPGAPASLANGFSVLDDAIEGTTVRLWV